MEKFIQDFPQQLEEALEIAENAKLKLNMPLIHHVVVSGMGGSAFGGEVVKNLTDGTGSVPVIINRDYTTPAFAGANTLWIASSYSGNTEETLTATHVAIDKQAQIVAITSGGKMQDLADKYDFSAIKIPGGYPPRAAFGFSVVQQLKVLSSADIIPEMDTEIKSMIRHLKAFDGHGQARNIAEQLSGKIPVMYTSPEFESAGIRFRQQIAENSKQLAWNHVIPEMNHNELVGWKHPEPLKDKVIALFVDSDHTNERNRIRSKLTRQIAEEQANVIQIRPEGDSHLQELFWLLHLIDWISYYLAQINNEDPTPVKVIDYLKGELKKV